MTTNINKLFADICKRGCIIEICSNYGGKSKNIPKCLVIIDKKISLELKIVIKSIIPNNNCVTFFCIYLEYVCMIGKSRVRFNDIYYDRNLDLIAYYLHCNNELLQGNSFDQLIQHTNTLPLENMIDYKQIIKNKMIENLTELYLIKFMYLTSKMLSLPEIKIVIVEILFKLDKWDDLL